MRVSRKGIGGRKQVVVHNPFVEVDVWGDKVNTLWDADSSIKLEDTIVSAVNAIGVDYNQQRAFVKWQLVVKVYRNCNVITRKGVQQYLKCSESQSKRYIQVIKLCNKLLQVSTNTVPHRYIDVTRLGK